MVSKASDDLPEPLSPVITVRELRGISTVDVLEIVLARAAHRDLCNWHPKVRLRRDQGQHPR
jgi:hypothetical protein